MSISLFSQLFQLSSSCGICLLLFLLYLNVDVFVGRLFLASPVTWPCRLTHCHLIKFVADTSTSDPDFAGYTQFSLEALHLSCYISLEQLIIDQKNSHAISICLQNIMCMQNIMCSYKKDTYSVLRSHSENIMMAVTHQFFGRIVRRQALENIVMAAKVIG